MWGSNYDDPTCLVNILSTTSKEAEDRLDVQLQHNSDKAILSI